MNQHCECLDCVIQEESRPFSLSQTIIKALVYLVKKIRVPGAESMSYFK